MGHTIADRRNPSIQLKVNADGSIEISNVQYTQALENDSNGLPIYVGEAEPGTTQASTGWRIKKITYSGNFITDIKWADGVNTFIKVWNDRATYTYS